MDLNQLCTFEEDKIKVVLSVKLYLDKEVLFKKE